MNTEANIRIARMEELNRRLRVLSEWALNRTTGGHDTETTITMLRRRVEEIEDGVNRAGWRATTKTDE